MGPVVSELAKLPESDRRAMAVYLASLKGEAAAESAATLQASEQASASTVSLGNGRRVFEGACQGCHADGLGPELFGVSPSLASNSNVHSALPDNLIKVILQGITTPATADLGYMPGFKDSLSDRQISELAAYLRNRFAPAEPAWQGLQQRVVHLRANPGTH